ncbi:Cytochrome c551 peroxidase precursor [Thalassoglobus polymorphus]|uniref:Cytochrome c551 peroxidase n=2 Tax=Thalassoglobus polymorphus TaxID=2527994 RepID=A0A517QI46_9PLAN|nr:Cytochrome c551 peroxidase precursor [Thalassoglobus polymorphus]
MNRILCNSFLCTLFLYAFFLDVTASAGTSNSLMDISTDGTLLVCSNRDSGTLSVIDLKTKRKLHEVQVGRHPECVTFVGESYDVAVAIYGEDRIDFVNAKSGKKTGSLDVFDEPYSVVSNADGSRLWATLEYPGEVIEIDPAKKAIVRQVQAGSFLRGLALHDDELLVTEYFTGIVKSIDVKNFEVVHEWTGSKEDNICRQITVHPTWSKAYLPHQRSLTEVSHGSGSIFPYLGIVNTDVHDKSVRKRKQMDSFRGTYVVANPWEVAISPDGKRLYIVFAGTNDMFVGDLLDDDYHEVEFAGLLRIGSNPRAVKVSPDSKTFYVYNALDFNVVAYDAATLRQQGEIKVTEWTGSPELLLGKKLFYTANPPMTSRRWISCSSCHPDGNSDGRTWQQPEGLRNTQAIFGLKETHPIHWSADRDEVQDFEHTIRSPLMGARGLIRGRVNDALGKPNAGLSRELDALSVYANSHPFELSPHAKQGLSESARRGKALFLSSEVGCAKCHSGPYATDLKMHDVGTGRDDPSELMGTKYDTPTLLGVYRTAPYLHDGTAATLRDVLTTTNPKDEHGKTSHLKSNDIDDLVEYMKVLPFELPGSP